MRIEGCQELPACEVDLLVVDGLLFSANSDNQVLKSGAVAICGENIVDIGTSEALTKQYTAKKTIYASHKLVMPGLIDVYHHAGHGMIKGIYRSGLGWPKKEVFFHGSTPDWWYADGLLSAVERVKFGVTTGVTVMGATPTRTDDAVYAEQNAAALEKVGLRGIITVGPPDPFINTAEELETTTIYGENGSRTERPYTYEQAIKVTEDVFRILQGSANGRVHAAITVPYLCGCNPQFMQGMHYYQYSARDVRRLMDISFQVRHIADQYDVLIHTHAGRGAIEWAEEHFGRKHLCNILGRDVIFAHANGLTDKDMDIVQEHDCAIAAVPYGPWTSYLGPCPIVELLKREVRVAISTDGAAPHFNSDPFSQLHPAMLLQQMLHHDRSVLPPGRAVKLITAEAAAVLGMEKTIGSLEVGKKADLILIDLDQPHLVPFEDAANMLAWFVRGNDVDSVIANGVILMEGRKMKTVEESEILDLARDQIDKAFARVDVTDYLQHGHDYWNGWRESFHSRSIP